MTSSVTTILCDRRRRGRHQVRRGAGGAAGGRVVGRRQQPTNAQRGGEAVLADVVELARSLDDEGARVGLMARAVGVGVAELVGPDGSRAERRDDRLARCWTSPEDSARPTGLPVRLEADVRAAARAEAQLGAGRGRSDFLYVTVGTGISASLVLDGDPLRGRSGTHRNVRQQPGSHSRRRRPPGRVARHWSSLPPGRRLPRGSRRQAAIHGHAAGHRRAV